MPDRNSLIAISDQGNFVRAQFIRDDFGRLSGIGKVEMRHLLGISGHPLSKSFEKAAQDCEAIERLGNGDYFVIFELNHRILRYSSLLRPPKLFAVPPGISNTPPNGGIEAMTLLPDGIILIMTENFSAKTKENKQPSDFI